MRPHFEVSLVSSDGDGQEAQQVHGRAIIGVIAVILAVWANSKP
jgi:hypothetical protein